MLPESNPNCERHKLGNASHSSLLIFLRLPLHRSLMILSKEFLKILSFLYKILFFLLADGSSLKKNSVRFYPRTTYMYFWIISLIRHLRGGIAVSLLNPFHWYYLFRVLKSD